MAIQLGKIYRKHINTDNISTAYPEYIVLTGVSGRRAISTNYNFIDLKYCDGVESHLVMPDYDIAIYYKLVEGDI